MNRIHIRNQIGTKGICGGPISIIREPTGLNYGRIQDWDEFCDEVDEVLRKPTRLRNCFQIGSFILTSGVFAGVFFLAKLDSRYIYLLLLSVLFMNLILYMVVLRRYNTHMKCLFLLGCLYPDLL